MKTRCTTLLAIGSALLNGACALFVREPVLLPAEQKEPEQVLQPASGALPERQLQDWEVRLAVRRALDDRWSGPLPEVEVAVEHGVFRLLGEVPNGLNALRAVQIAETVRGVRAVINQLRVDARPVPDTALARAVHEELSDDPLFAPVTIKPSVHGGEVVLRGRVRSFTERQVAERLVWSIRGVTAVRNELRVVPEIPRHDPEIAADVRRRLAIDAYLQGDPLRVRVNDGVVTLSGSVGSAFEKRRALANAWVTGTRGVQTRELTVDTVHGGLRRREAPSLTSDELKRAVSDALHFDPRIWDAPIQVSSAGAVVTLFGSVPSWEMRRLAEVDAQQTVGVWHVVNRLVVRPQQPVGDEELERRVLSKLVWYPASQGELVRARVEDGAVWLEGRVASRYSSLQLERAIGRIPGVTAVHNDLAVSAPLAALRDDAMLERQIETEIWWDPRLDASQVDVDVRGGTAILTGVVESRQAYDALMEHVMSAAPRSVENRLRRAPAR